MQALREYIRLKIADVLLEGRLESAQKKYAGKIDDQTFQLIVANDPSGNQKYLDWACREIVAGAKAEDVIPTFNQWDSIGKNLPERDIYKLSAKQAEDSLKDYDTKQSGKRKQKYYSIKGADIIGETDRHIIYFVRTHDASRKLGTGTKWCITMGNSKHWDQYAKERSNFYFLIPKRSNEKKFAIEAQCQLSDQTKFLEDVKISINYNAFSADDVQKSPSEHGVEDSIPIIDQHYKVVIAGIAKEENERRSQLRVLRKNATKIISNPSSSSQDLQEIFDVCTDNENVIRRIINHHNTSFETLSSVFLPLPDEVMIHPTWIEKRKDYFYSYPYNFSDCEWYHERLQEKKTKQAQSEILDVAGPYIMYGVMEFTDLPIDRKINFANKYIGSQISKYAASVWLNDFVSSDYVGHEKDIYVIIKKLLEYGAKSNNSKKFESYKEHFSNLGLDL